MVLVLVKYTFSTLASSYWESLTGKIPKVFKTWISNLVKNGFSKDIKA